MNALDRIVLVDKEKPLVLPKTKTALGLLQAIYQDEEMPLPVRLRCAMAALPFESPKLVAVANVNGGDFGERLEKARERTVGLLEARAKGLDAVVELVRKPLVIEGEATEVAEHPPSELGKPLPSTAALHRRRV